MWSLQPQDNQKIDFNDLPAGLKQELFRGQEHNSGFMCAVDATPKACTGANNQMTGGFIGMIFGFFIAFFGAS